MDYEQKFAETLQEIIDESLHERGIYVVTEDEADFMLRDVRSLYIKTLGEFRRMSGLSDAPKIRLW